MSTFAFQAENISKSYIIGHKIDKHTGVRHLLESALRKPADLFRKSGSQLPESKEEFWALKDINFGIKEGEVIGVVGRNGAGKSTLLKILSRITHPTTGRIKVRGRVASLLEVGTGFHPELTGRENIFLNGSIMGMTRTEIKKNFDAIVDFSDIEKFLDTPVKRYSSGMYVRLAFAIAAHLQPEILIIDEVLAVGDAKFQAKCLSRMQEVANESGRTILFVSHNMSMIESICSRCILLQSGQIVSDGPTAEIITQFLSQLANDSKAPAHSRTDRNGTGEVMLQSVSVINHSNQATNTVSCGQAMSIDVHYKTFAQKKALENGKVTVTIKKLERIHTLLSTWAVDSEPITFEKEGIVRFHLDRCPLTSGQYMIDTVIEDDDFCDILGNAHQFTVVEGNFYGTGRIITPKTRNFWKDTGVLTDYSYRHLKD